MKYIKNNLTIFAFAIGVLGAFAFQNPDDEDQMLFGKLNNGQWVPVQEGYSCNFEPERTCTARLDPDTGEPIRGTKTPGRYNPNPDL